MPTSWTEDTVTVADTAVHIYRGGEGPPLLYLHGGGGNLGWLMHHDALAEHFTVYATSHPGFGRTPRPEWIGRVPDMTVFYLWLLDTLGLDRVHLVGHRDASGARHGESRRGGFEIERTDGLPGPKGIQPDYSLSATVSELPNRGTSYYYVQFEVTDLRDRRPTHDDDGILQRRRVGRREHIYIDQGQRRRLLRGARADDGQENS